MRCCLQTIRRDEAEADKLLTDDVAGLIVRIAQLSDRQLAQCCVFRLIEDHLSPDKHASTPVPKENQRHMTLVLEQAKYLADNISTILKSILSISRFFLGR